MLHNINETLASHNVQNKPLGFASVKGWLKAKTEGQLKTKCGES